MIFLEIVTAWQLSSKPKFVTNLFSISCNDHQFKTEFKIELLNSKLNNKNSELKDLNPFILWINTIDVIGKVLITSSISEIFIIKYNRNIK